MRLATALALLSVVSVVSAISYTCVNDQVLIVQSFGNDTIRMHCQRLDLCGYRNLKCGYDEEQLQCGGKHNFVARVEQSSPTSPVSHTCCNLGISVEREVPVHDGNDCFVYELPDGTGKGEVLDGSGEDFTILKGGATSIPEQFPGYSGYRLRLFLLRNKSPPTLVVKGIERRTDGYRVTICRPRCGKSPKEGSVKPFERIEAVPIEHKAAAITKNPESIVPLLKPGEYIYAVWETWRTAQYEHRTHKEWSSSTADSSTSWGTRNRTRGGGRDREDSTVDREQRKLDGSPGGDTTSSNEMTRVKPGEDGNISGGKPDSAQKTNGHRKGEGDSVNGTAAEGNASEGNVNRDKGRSGKPKGDADDGDNTGESKAENNGSKPTKSDGGGGGHGEQNSLSGTKEAGSDSKKKTTERTEESAGKKTDKQEGTSESVNQKELPDGKDSDGEKSKGPKDGSQETGKSSSGQDAHDKNASKGLPEGPDGMNGKGGKSKADDKGKEGDGHDNVELHIPHGPPGTEKKVGGSSEDSYEASPPGFGKSPGSSAEEKGNSVTDTTQKGDSGPVQEGVKPVDSGLTTRTTTTTPKTESTTKTKAATTTAAAVTTATTATTTSTAATAKVDERDKLKVLTMSPESETSTETSLLDKMRNAFSQLTGGTDSSSSSSSSSSTSTQRSTSRSSSSSQRSTSRSSSSRSSTENSGATSGVPSRKQAAEAAKNIINSDSSGASAPSNAGGAAASADTGASGSAAKNCFSAETKVFTPSGEKTMRELEVGDYVLVPAGGEVMRYERVEMFYHREPDTVAKFVVLETESGRSLTLTELHLLPFGECSYLADGVRSIEVLEQRLRESRFAHKVAAGQCVLAVDRNGRLIAERVLRVSRRVLKGIYSPMTVEGAILTDGVLSSCFSQLESHFVQKLLYDFLLSLYSIFGFLASLHEPIQHLPSFVHSVHSLSHYVIPFAKY